MRKFIIGFIVVFSLIVFKALYFDSSQKKGDFDPAFHIEGNTTATFTLKDTEGKDYTISQYGDKFVVDGYDNKLVVFNFFATYCSGCRKEIPMLVDLKKKYGDKIQIIGVAVDNDLSNDKLKEFKEEFSSNYSMANGSKNNLEWAICSTLPAGSCNAIPLNILYTKGQYRLSEKGAGEDLGYIENVISTIP